MAGIYFHTPFCRSRCIYCDFFSSTSLAEKESYVDAMCLELTLRKNYLQKQDIRTIYFGGGTPSQLSAEDFEKIFQTINRCYPNLDIQSLEITLEANPDDITPSYLDSILHLPFNRISLGVQSFNDRELQFLRRRHDAKTAIDAVKRLQSNGFENISIDLMYGLPKQSSSTWKANLRQAIDLRLHHISAYHLTYEEGTPLFKFKEQKTIQAIDEMFSIRFFDILIDTLMEAGFEHYEISNFAQIGYRSKHNSSYWNGAHYLGIGAAAHSYNGSTRQWNKRIADATYLEQGLETETIDAKTAYNDFIITRLRTREGIDWEELILLFGEEKKIYCLKQADKYLADRMLEMAGQYLRLTRKGLFISDSIMSDLIE